MRIAKSVLAFVVAASLFDCSNQTEKNTSPVPAIDRAKLSELTKLAEASCLCEFKGGNASECNKVFARASAGIALEAFGTACAPIASEIQCLPGGPPNCFATRYSVVGGRGFVCTEEQADTLGAIWNRVQAGRAGSTKQADKALKTALERMKRGEKISRPSGKSGCN